MRELGSWDFLCFDPSSFRGDCNLRGGQLGRLDVCDTAEARAWILCIPADGIERSVVDTEGTTSRSNRCRALRRILLRERKEKIAPKDAEKGFETRHSSLGEASCIVLSLNLLRLDFFGGV